MFNLPNFDEAFKKMAEFQLMFDRLVKATEQNARDLAEIKKAMGIGQSDKADWLSGEGGTHTQKVEEISSFLNRSE